jgi:hypothetical protein
VLETVSQREGTLRTKIAVPRSPQVVDNKEESKAKSRQSNACVQVSDTRVPFLTLQPTEWPRDAGVCAQGFVIDDTLKRITAALQATADRSNNLKLRNNEWFQ